MQTTIWQRKRYDLKIMICKTNIGICILNNEEKKPLAKTQTTQKNPYLKFS